MENIKIPDNFYFNEGVLAHKSCIYRHDKNEYSNDRYIKIDQEVRQSDVDNLRDICNIYDILNEKTYFEESRYKNMYTDIYYKNLLRLFVDNNDDDYDYIDFYNINELLEYLTENYPECIKDSDIKIALKD
jgi:hypothetical protein